MWESLLDFLACPICRGPLRLHTHLAIAGETETGQLECRSCVKGYPVDAGIPRLLPEAARALDATAGATPLDREQRARAEGLRFTIEHYSSYQAEVYSPLADRLDNRSILRARTGLDLEDFAGRLCLDAGCGVGRMTRLLAGTATLAVVGMDAGLAVDEARKRSLSAKNLHWVQGDILRPPFQPGRFDRVISLGVLHHTMEPDRGFRELARLVSAQGTLSTYLYHRRYKDWRYYNLPRVAVTHLKKAVVDEPFRRFVARWPNGARRTYCELLWRVRQLVEKARPLGPIGALLSRVYDRVGPPNVYKPRESAASNVARLYDMYSTPYNYTHDLVEVVDWFERDGGFDQLDITPYRISITGRRGVRAPGQPLSIRYHRSEPADQIEARGVEAEAPAS